MQRAAEGNAKQSYAAGLFVLALACSGCQTLDTVQVEDRNTRDFAASIAIRPESLRGRDNRSGGGFEFAYERHRGDSLQHVGSNHYVSFENRAISGPQDIGNWALSQHWAVSYTHMLAFGNHFELEPGGGLAYERTEAKSQTVSLPLRTLYVIERNWGFNGLITPRWKFNEHLAFEVRLRASISRDSSISQTLFPSLVLRPTENVALHAGYMEYSQEVETPHGTSNVELEFSGPSVALRVSF